MLPLPNRRSCRSALLTRRSVTHPTSFYPLLPRTHPSACPALVRPPTSIAEKLWRVGKSDKMGFKAQKKLITRKRECSARVGRSRADDCDGVVCVRSKGS